ncbi:MAG: putative rane protein [Acidobacteria bacterium]|nr:putative rane protein [Acidobacteriota bacterium]
MKAAPAPHSETARQWVHIASGLFALLLRGLNGWQAAALAAAALLFNVALLPRVGGRRLYRPVDHHRGFPLGILLYPLSVLLLMLAFPHRLDIAAASWGILAFGDGFATLLGRRASQQTGENAAIGEQHVFVATSAIPAVPSGRLPWNPDKSIAGTIAFVVFGSIAGAVLAWWVRPAVVPVPPLMFALVAPVAAAIVAALAETIPIRLDDNITVPATAGLVLWLASLTTTASLTASSAALGAALPWAIGVNVLTGWLGYRARTVSRSGAITGALVGAVIYAGGGLGAWILLLVTFVAASVTSRLGLARKERLGIAEERGGRRGPGNAIANCGVAAIAAIAAVTTPYPRLALAALVAALTAAGSDTVASEIGKAWGRAAFLVTTLRRVPPGTPGAMSLEGTAAGVAAAVALAAAGAALGLVPVAAIAMVAAAATAGALVESVLGATLEGPGMLNNDMLNFINTAVAAAVVIVFA